jgi:hypothetical protein
MALCMVRNIFAPSWLNSRSTGHSSHSFPHSPISLLSSLFYHTSYVSLLLLLGFRLVSRSACCLYLAGDFLGFLFDPKMETVRGYVSEYSVVYSICLQNFNPSNCFVASSWV